MSEKERAASGRPGRGAHLLDRRRAWMPTWWRVAAASGLVGMATITAGLVVAGPAGAATGTAASTVTQSVSDATSAQPWSNSEMTGASAFDTATVAGTSSAVPTGSVTYQLFDGGNCAGSAVSSEDVSLDSSGTALASQPTAALGAGTYSYLASYSGDGTYAPSQACAAFSVLPAYDSTDVVIYDAQTHQPWSGLETTGALVYEKAAINSVPGFPPTGTVTYTLMSLPDPTACAGPVLSTQTVTLNPNGTVPRSSLYGPLAPGTYEYETSYSGDANHRSSGTYGCAGQFTVLATSPLTATRTVVYDAATTQPWSGQEVAGASAYDTATVSTHSGTTPTGTVTYSLYEGSCASPGHMVGTADTVTLDPHGNVPNSSPSGPLLAGTYCYHVSYSGDANNNPSSDGCGEQFTVLPAVPEISAVKTSDATSPYVQPGQHITYTVTVTNSGLAPDNTVTVTDTNPANTTYVQGSAQCPVGVQCTVHTATSAGQTQITWTFPQGPATLDPSTDTIVPTTASVTFQAAVNASPGECTKIDNVANVDGTPTNHVTLETVYPSLHLSLTAVPQPVTSQGTGGKVSEGETITYTIHWSNTGTADAVASTVTDTIPAGATYVAGSASNGATLDPGTLNWAGIDMVAGTSGTLTFQVTVDHADQNGFHVLNQAQVSSTPGSQPTVTQSPTCTGATPGWSAASNQTVHVVVVTSTTTTTPPTTTEHSTAVVPTQTTAPAPDQTTTSTTDPAGLAFTGGNTLRGLEAAGVVLAGGALLVLASRQRRRRKA